MSETVARNPGRRRTWLTVFGFALTFAWATLSFSASSLAEKKIAFAKLADADPREFALAKELLGSHTRPSDYDPSQHVDFWGRPWPNTLDGFLRAAVRFGRGDLNDNGVDELFYYFEAPGYCGSIGCPTLIFEKRGLTWHMICGTSGDDGLRITDYVTEGGGDWREMEQRYRIFWQKDVCHLDTPERLEYHPPPPGRVWKPMR